jgi:hypothetical protein
LIKKSKLIKLQIVSHASCNDKYKPITIVYMGTIATEINVWVELS